MPCETISFELRHTSSFVWTGLFIRYVKAVSYPIAPLLHGVALPLVVAALGLLLGT